MEIYTDIEAQKAILVCNANELAHIEHALFSKAKSWYDKAKDEKENWQQDLDLKIGAEVAELDKVIASHVQWNNEEEIFKLK